MSFWVALVLVPVALGLVGVVLERLFIRRLAALDPLYNFLLTFGLALILQDLVKREYGVQSQPYPRPTALSGSVDLGLFSYPAYQVFVLAVAVVACLAVWYVLSRTRVGMIVRAATERPELTRALGIDVGRWVTPVFGFGIALAGLAGVLAAPMRAVNPLMGADLIIAVFAVVVIGGLGSIFGSVAAGFADRGGRRAVQPVRPVALPDAGVHPHGRRAAVAAGRAVRTRGGDRVIIEQAGRPAGPARPLGLLVALALPWMIYPPVAMDIDCWALFAVAVDLLLGFTGLLSFGHAAFWGTSAYVTGLIALHSGLPFPVAVARRRAGRGGARGPDRLAVGPPYRHLLRDGDPGVRADGLLRRQPVARR